MGIYFEPSILYTPDDFAVLFGLHLTCTKSCLVVNFQKLRTILFTSVEIPSSHELTEKRLKIFLPVVLPILYCHSSLDDISIFKLYLYTATIQSNNCMSLLMLLLLLLQKLFFFLRWRLWGENEYIRAHIYRIYRLYKSGRMRMRKRTWTMNTQAYVNKLQSISRYTEICVCEWERQVFAHTQQKTFSNNMCMWYGRKLCIRKVLLIR